MVIVALAPELAADAVGQKQLLVLAHAQLLQNHWRLTSPHLGKDCHQEATCPCTAAPLTVTFVHAAASTLHTQLAWLLKTLAYTPPVLHRCYQTSLPCALAQKDRILLGVAHQGTASKPGQSKEQP